MDIDKETSLMLIQLYENQVLLWNPKHKWHFHKTKKMNSWQEIADSSNLTVDEAKTKMNSLLDTFKREKNKGVKTIGTGKEICRSDWFAFKQFSFLLDKDEPRKTISSEERIETETQSEIIDIDNNDILNPPESNDESSYLQCTSRSEESFVKLLKAKSKRKRMRKVVGAQEAPRIEMAFRMLQQPVEPKDATTKYAEYLAEKLNQFDSLKKSVLIHKITNLIVDAEMSMFSVTENSDEEFSPLN